MKRKRQQWKKKTFLSRRKRPVAKETKKIRRRMSQKVSRTTQKRKYSAFL